MRVVVLTTSYPRPGAEHAGRFVADAVEHLRAAGIGVDVLAPGGYRDFGLAGPDGIMPQLRTPALGGAAARRLDDPRCARGRASTRISSTRTGFRRPPRRSSPACPTS